MLSAVVFVNNVLEVLLFDLTRAIDAVFPGDFVVVLDLRVLVVSLREFGL